MQVVQKIRRAASKAVSGVKQELRVLATVEPQAQAALRRMERRDPGLKAFLKRAHAYAVFPSVGKAAAVLGAAFGTGVVFHAGELVGYAGIVQATLGVELGGATFSQVVAFDNDKSFGRFKRSPLKFAANASAVMVKAGAAASAAYEKGVTVFVHARGGLMLEAAVGGQKFVFKPAVLGRGKEVRHVRRKPRRTGPGPTRQAAKSRN